MTLYVANVIVWVIIVRAVCVTRLIWTGAQERIARPRGAEEIELEAFELAVDAQVCYDAQLSHRREAKRVANSVLPRVAESTSWSVNISARPS